MNTQFIAHPKLQHVGLTTANLDAMIDWYRKVVGMTVNYRAAVPGRAPHRPSFSIAFLANDEFPHRLALFEMPGLVVDPDKMIAACQAGASPWEVHERALGGEFAPTKPYEPRTPF
jgi:catechol 2,3-dioxygenase-like lactoylglutathione lyase family enzyme